MQGQQSWQLLPEKGIVKFKPEVNCISSMNDIKWRNAKSIEDFPFE
jgi:hypothetical protein